MKKVARLVLVAVTLFVAVIGLSYVVSMFVATVFLGVHEEADAGTWFIVFVISILVGLLGEIAALVILWNSWD